MQNKAQQLTQRYFEEENWVEKQVKVFESLAARDPKGYLQKTISFSKLGTIYLTFLVALITIISVVAIWFVIRRPGTLSLNICIFLLPILYGLLKSLFVKIPEPSGYELQRQDGSSLWATVDELIEKSGAPKVDKIFLNWDVNAYAAQTQKFGMWGQKRQFLVLGIPLMRVLTPDELRFVIAHEFGHFAGEHGIKRGYIYRSTSQLQNVEQNLEGRVSAFLLGRFLKWYMPRMRARSFVLDRQQEFEADLFAARVTNRDHIWALAKAIVGSNGYNAVYERWEKLAQDLESPHLDFVRDLVDRLNIDADQDEVKRQISLFYNAQTSYSDTHPSLRDRAKALAATNRSETELVQWSLISPEENALDYFVSPELLQKILDEVSISLTVSWRYKHEEFQKEKTYIDQLRNLPDPTIKEQLAILSFDYRITPNEENEAKVWTLLEQHPENADVNYAIGYILSEKKNLRAEEFLMKASRLNSRLAADAAALMVVVRQANGIQDNKDLERMMIASHFESTTEEEDLLSNPLSGVLVPTTLRDRDISTIVTKIKGLKIKHAYVVSKSLPSQEVVNILVVIPSGMIVSDQAGANLVDEILALQGFPEVFVYGPNGKFGAIEKRLEKVPGAKLF